MEISELKKEVHKDLTELKEKERLERVKEHKDLKKLTLYTKENHPPSDGIKKFLDQEGIKYQEKDLEKNKMISAAVGTGGAPIIFVNNNYLVQGRDFPTPNKSLPAIKYYADPNFVDPPFETKIIEQLKNLNTGINQNLGRSFQTLTRQLQPVLQLLKEVAEEEKK